MKIEAVIKLDERDVLDAIAEYVRRNNDCLKGRHFTIKVGTRSGEYFAVAKTKESKS